MYSTPMVRAYASRSTPRMSRSFMASLAREPAGGELAVEVPDREAPVVRVELRVGVRLLQAERIEVRDEVPAHAVHVDELLHGDDLLGASTEPSSGLWSGDQRAGSYGNAEAGEDVVVEAVAPEQEVVERRRGTRRSPRPG